jgi:AbrB family looped-hinge helix DNA binding protein
MKDVKISSKGQITLPKKVREALGVEPGDQVRFLILGDQVRLVKPVDLMSLYGLLKPHLKPGQVVSLEEMKEAAAAAWAGEGDDES